MNLKGARLTKSYANGAGVIFVDVALHSGSLVCAGFVVVGMKPPPCTQAPLFKPKPSVSPRALGPATEPKAS